MAKEVEEERVLPENIRPHYPEVWEKFLKEKNQTDQVVLQFKDKHKADSTWNVNIHLEYTYNII